MHNYSITTISSQFPQTGLVRLSQILAPAGPIPISRSGWWAGVKSGRFPKPVKLSPRVTCWRAEDIWALVSKSEAVGAQGGDHEETE